MTEEYVVARYDQACDLLPQRLRPIALEVPREKKSRTEELRLRVGQPLGLTTPEGEVSLSQTHVISADLELVLDRATEFSRYAAAETIRQGYLTAHGGFRIGLCGRALAVEGENRAIRDLTSLAIRIPRVCQDVARPILPKLLENGMPLSTLILSPPGGGKTTLLRDLVRLYSQGTELSASMRVSLVDERGEIAALYRGRPQLDVGRLTDVMELCPKAQAVSMLLRAMNPQIIALDEIALDQDVEAVCAAVGCGARLLATVHSGSVAELQQRPVGRRLLQCAVFHRAVIILGRGQERSYQVEKLM